jgi:membrane protein implicated in regulation of membrane protease activity
MASLLAWYNLIFYIPVAVGLLFVVGIAAGVTDVSHSATADLDADVDGDLDADAHPEHAIDVHGDHHGFLSVLGFGRVPLGLLSIIMLLTFGGGGVAANFFLGNLVAKNGLFVLVSLAVAVITMFVATALLGRSLARFAPSIETDSTTKYDLIGCTGVLVLSANETGGLAQIQRKGDVYRVQCRAPELLEKGAPIIVTDYDEDTKVYSVCRDPVK